MDGHVQICNLLPMGMKQRFDNGHEINLEDWLWHYKDDGALDQIRCFILPSLIEGFIIGEIFHFLEVDLKV